MDALEAEHAAIDPLLAAVEDAAADREYGYQRFGDLADALVATLSGHLSHEESDGLALIDATLTEQEWKNFSDVHRSRIGEDRTRYMPWLLDRASERTLETILGGFPEQFLNLYHGEWAPAYAALDLWADGSGSGVQWPAPSESEEGQEKEMSSREDEIELAPAVGQDSAAQRGLGAALLVIAAAQLMLVLDTTIVNVALPSMQKALHVSAGDLNWVIAAPTRSPSAACCWPAGARATCSAAGRSSASAWSCSPSPRWSAAWPRTAAC